MSEKLTAKERNLAMLSAVWAYGYDYEFGIPPKLFDDEERELHEFLVAGAFGNQGGDLQDFSVKKGWDYIRVVLPLYYRLVEKAREFVINWYIADYNPHLRHVDEYGDLRWGDGDER